MITKLRDYIWNKDNEEYLAREKYSPYALQQARNIVKYWTIDKAKHREFVEWISKRIKRLRWCNLGRKI